MSEPGADSRPAVADALAALEGGGCIVYPTETVYGLCVDASSASALGALLQLKGRDEGKGMSLLVTGLTAAAELVAGAIPPAALRLTASFWPGPLTVVLPAASHLDCRLLGPGGGIGLRCSSDPLAAELARAFGRPITSTSANPAGRRPAAAPAAAREYFGHRVAVYLDGGSRSGGSQSTVVEFSRGRTYLRRSGEIDAGALSALVKVEV